MIYSYGFLPYVVSFSLSRPFEEAVEGNEACPPSPCIALTGIALGAGSPKALEGSYKCVLPVPRLYLIRHRKENLHQQAFWWRLIGTGRESGGGRL